MLPLDHDIFNCLHPNHVESPGVQNNVKQRCIKFVMDTALPVDGAAPALKTSVLLWMYRIAKHYKSTLNPDLVCMGKPDAMKWWLVPAACVFVTLALTVWRCARGSGDDVDNSGMSSRRSSLTSHSFGGHHRAY
jgi:hypothetical protein